MGTGILPYHGSTARNCNGLSSHILCTSNGYRNIAISRVHQVPYTILCVHTMPCVVDPCYGDIPAPIALCTVWALVDPGYDNIPVPIACAQYMRRQTVTFTCCGSGIWQYSCTHCLCTVYEKTDRYIYVLWTRDKWQISVPIVLCTVCTKVINHTCLC